MSDLATTIAPCRSDDSTRAKYDGIDYPSVSASGDSFPLQPEGTGLPVAAILAPEPVALWSHPLGLYVAAGAAVVFENLSQYAHTYLWNFGGGDTSEEETPTRTWTTPGTRGVTLTAISDYGAEDDFFAYVDVVEIVAAFDWLPSDPEPGEEIAFEDESPYAETWEWDFGDGSAHSTAQNPLHTYATAGTYSVSLTVTGYGGTDTTMHSVEVASAATWQEMTDDTWWAPEADWPYPWGGSYCSGGDAWCCYVDAGGDPAVLLPVGTWATGWRPSQIVIYGCEFEYDPFQFRILDTAGNVIASGGVGGGGNPITFQGADIARLEYWQDGSTSIYGCVTEIHFYGPAPA